MHKQSAPCLAHQIMPRELHPTLPSPSPPLRQPAEQTEPCSLGRTGVRHSDRPDGCSRHCSRHCHYTKCAGRHLTSRSGPSLHRAPPPRHATHCMLVLGTPRPVTAAPRETNNRHVTWLVPARRRLTQAEPITKQSRDGMDLSRGAPYVVPCGGQGRDV